MKLATFKENHEKANMPQELKDILMKEASIWTNDACYGYIIMAMADADFKSEDISKVLRQARDVMDFVTPEEAEQHYWNSNY